MRLIEPDELEKVLRPILTDESCPLHIAAEIDMNLDLMPKVDAVPVQRCKHWKTAEGVNLSKRVRLCTYHIWHQYARHDEDFCSRGERKDGEAHD